MELTMNKFEKELLDYLTEVFRSEIDQGIVTIKDNTDEKIVVIQETDSGGFATKSVNNCESWMVEIRKTTTQLKHVRIVIESPDANKMNKIENYPLVLKTMAERAKSILNNPPFSQYINQGVIRATFDGEVHVEFIPHDEVR
jgi:hypothetical protein